MESVRIDIRGREALVLGLGSSGQASSLLLAEEGSTVTAVDRGDVDEGIRTRLAAAGIRVVASCDTLPERAFALAVVSPGVKLDSAWMSTLRRRGVPAVSELEYGWSRRHGARVLAVTGSNGKSTMVKLCAEALARAGRRTAIAGNYGPPVTAVVRERTDLEWLVLEVSSFQLETVQQFRPEVGVLLNIHPNHLDRHGDMQTYAALKARLFARMDDGDVAVMHEEALPLIAGCELGRGRRMTFGVRGAADYRYADGRVFVGRGVAGGAGAEAADFRGTDMANEVLGLTAAAAVAALGACGLTGGQVVDTAAAFEKLPHRLRKIAEFGGVVFVDDSKATNMEAVCAALRVVPGPVRLIAGGLLKERRLEGVKESLARKVVKVYGIGQSASVLAREWGGCVAVDQSGTLEQAVRSAWREAGAGETILLSPGCASFDQFKSFEERGNRFRVLVS